MRNACADSLIADHFTLGAGGVHLQDWQGRAVAEETGGTVRQANIRPAGVARTHRRKALLHPRVGGAIRARGRIGDQPVDRLRCSHEEVADGVALIAPCPTAPPDDREVRVHAVEVLVLVVAFAPHHRVAGPVRDFRNGRAAVDVEDTVVTDDLGTPREGPEAVHTSDPTVAVQTVDVARHGRLLLAGDWAGGTDENLDHLRRDRAFWATVRVDVREVPNALQVVLFEIGEQGYEEVRELRGFVGPRCILDDAREGARRGRVPPRRLETAIGTFVVHSRQAELA